MLAILENKVGRGDAPFYEAFWRTLRGAPLDSETPSYRPIALLPVHAENVASLVGRADTLRLALGCKESAVIALRARPR